MWFEHREGRTNFTRTAEKNSNKNILEGNLEFISYATIAIRQGTRTEWDNEIKCDKWGRSYKTENCVKLQKKLLFRRKLDSLVVKNWNVLQMY